MISFCIIYLAFYLDVFELTSLMTTPKTRADGLSLMLFRVKIDVSLAK
jgi:hypothetical protein